MSNVVKILKAEIARISKKEAKSATAGDWKIEHMAEENRCGFEEKVSAA